MHDFGDTLRSLMERKRMTGQQLSGSIGISATSVSKILHGHSKPRQATLRRIVKALCETTEEEKEILTAYYGIERHLPEEQVEEFQASYNTERELAERQMESRTQAMAFKNAVARELSSEGVDFKRDYCDRGFSTDFLILRDNRRIAIETNFNPSRNINRSILITELLIKHGLSSESYVVVPFFADSGFDESQAVKIITIADIHTILSKDWHVRLMGTQHTH